MKKKIANILVNLKNLHKSHEKFANILATMKFFSKNHEIFTKNLEKLLQILKIFPNNLEQFPFKIKLSLPKNPLNIPV